MAAETSRIKQSVIVALSVMGVVASCDAKLACTVGRTPVSASGRWRVSIEQPAASCRWVGVVVLEQRGSMLSGRGRARRATGTRCPAVLAGTINGDVRGSRVRFGFALGRLGRASFAGEIDGRGRMSGTWVARSSSGHWEAAR